MSHPYFHISYPLVLGEHGIRSDGEDFFFRPPLAAPCVNIILKGFVKYIKDRKYCIKKIEVILNNMFIVQIIALCYYKNIIS